MTKKRIGYEESVGRFRAKAKTNDPEKDMSPMVQELVARLKFVASHISLTGKNILDYGCGTGVGSQWLRLHSKCNKIVGLDISKGAIASAKEKYSGIDCRIMNVENNQDLKKEFDIALCFEVLEHLNNPENAISHLVEYYLKPNGILIASTPNCKVFSDGMRPSPINRTHINEMDLYELRNLVSRQFEEVKIFGIRFKDPVRGRAYARMVKHSCSGYRLLGRYWWNPIVSRVYRWLFRGEIISFVKGKQYYRWMASDFEFIDNPEHIDDTAIWFLAIATNLRVKNSSK